MSEAGARGAEARRDSTVSPSSGELRLKRRDVSMLGISLNGLSPALQFIVVCLMLFFFHMTYAYLQVRTHLRSPKSLFAASDSPFLFAGRS